MTLDEFTHILEIHGSDSARWPESARDECLALVHKDSQARALLRSFELLDASLDGVPQPQFPGLEQRLVSQPLPARRASPLDTLIAWLLPEQKSPSAWWRPAVAACLPLVFGIVIGNFYSFGFISETDGFRYWDDELLMLSFNDYSEIQP